MSVDTANKRYSIISVTSPWRGLMRAPTGTVDADERFAFIYLYAGALTGGAVIAFVMSATRRVRRAIR